MPGPQPGNLEQAILGGLPELTAPELAAAAGVTSEQARRLWRALGFPEYPDDIPAFLAADAEAMGLLGEVMEAGVLDMDLAVNLTRALGQTMARLADWEISSLTQRVEEMTAEGAGRTRIDTAVSLVEQFSRPFEHLLIYAWRRHLAAAAGRIEALADQDDEDLHVTDLTVGFADIVGFTALSNTLTEDRIGDLVELFEMRCADVVSAQRGRVIKSIGDSVLFVNDDPVRAYDTAEGIIQVIGRDPRMPDVRVGLASGSVVMRLGDVAGEHGRAPDQRGSSQPDHHRLRHGHTAPGRPVRDPADGRPAGAGVRDRRARRRTPALTDAHLGPRHGARTSGPPGGIGRGN